MKKAVCIILAGLMAFSVFGQEDEKPLLYELEGSYGDGKPLILYELGSGYGIGINMAGSVPLEIRMTVPLSNWGYMLFGGVDFGKNIGGHGFIGATYFFINNSAMRLPVSLGFTISGNKKNFYLGLSSLVSYHYIFAKNVYAGINLEITYNFNDRYTVIDGNGDGMATNGVDGSGNPITTFPSPETKAANHWGSYVTIKPTICIGYELK